MLGVEADYKLFNSKNIVFDPTKKYSLFQHTKKYHPNRETELYKMLKSGCYVADKKYFEILKKINES